MGKIVKENKPATAWHIIRRCTRGSTFMGVNARKATQIFTFCLGLCAKPLGIRVMAMAVMSNHVHLVLWDSRGTLSKFCKRFFRLTALCLKVMLREPGEGVIWDDRGVKSVCLTDEHSILETSLYVMQNPIKHNIVDSPEELSEYPNYVTSIADIASAKRHRPRRPRYFSESGSIPERGELILEPPPNFELDEWVYALEYSWLAHAEKLLSERKDAGPRRHDCKSPRQALRGITLGEQYSKMPDICFAGAAATRIPAEEEYAAFQVRYRAAKSSLLSDQPIPFPPGTVPSPVTVGARIETMTQEEIRERTARLRAELDDSELRFPTRFSTPFAEWRDEQIAGGCLGVRPTACACPEPEKTRK